MPPLGWYCRWRRRQQQQQPSKASTAAVAAAATAIGFRLLCCAAVVAAAADSVTLLFTRIDRRRLDAAPVLSLTAFSADRCASACLNQMSLRCLSFDYDDLRQTCHLHNGSALRHGLLPSFDRDHYQGTFQRMFTRLIGSYVPMYLGRWEQLRIEQCAGKCLGVSLCSGFLVRTSESRHYCMLSNGTVQENGLQVNSAVNFYERIKGGTMSNFVNYGPGVRSSGVGRQHKRVDVADVDIESCAHECLTNSSLKCSSFDYLMATRTCLFWSEETVGQLSWPSDRIESVHYERKGRYMDFFWPLLYQGPPGVSPLRRISRGSSPGLCAKSCLEESQFVCRSFAFVMPDNSCELYAVSAGDFGTLYDATLVSRQSHYYVLEPMYYCGGTEKRESGYISSPNWPYSFSAGQECKWSLEAGAAKVIRIKLHRLAVGDFDRLEVCSIEDNAKLLTKISQTATDRFFCIDLAENDTGRSQSVVLGQKVSIFFRASQQPSHRSDVGFMLSYESEPSCGQRFNQVRGQFASPNGLSRGYSATTNCSWTIIAREGSSIKVRFEKFSVERGANLTDCRNRQNYILLYGKTYRRTFCGERKPFEVLVDETALTIIFVSNQAVEEAAISATYEVHERLMPTDMPGYYSSTTDVSSKFATQLFSDLPLDNDAVNLTDDLESFLLVPIAAEAAPILDMAVDRQLSKLQIWGIVSGGLIVILGIAVIIFTMHRRSNRRRTTLGSPSPWLSSHAAHELTFQQDASNEASDKGNGEVELLLFSSNAYQRTLSEDDGYISDIAGWQTDRNLGQLPQPKARSLAMSMHESCY